MVPIRVTSIVLPPAFTTSRSAAAKPGADEADQHLLLEAVAEDEQFLVGAVLAAGEHL